MLHLDRTTVTVTGPVCLLALGWWSLDEKANHERALKPAQHHVAMMEAYSVYAQSATDNGHTVTPQGIDNGSFFYPNPEYRLIGMEL